MTTNVNHNAPSLGLGDTVAKALHYFGVTTLAEATLKFFGKEGKCNCENRRLLWNELVAYNPVRKVRVLRSIPLSNSKGELIFTCVKGEVFEINEQHPVFFMLFPLVKGQILEEV